MSDRLVGERSYSRRPEADPKSFPHRDSPERKRFKGGPSVSQDAPGFGNQRITWEPQCKSAIGELRPQLLGLDSLFMEADNQSQQQVLLSLGQKTTWRFTKARPASVRAPLSALPLPLAIVETPSPPQPFRLFRTLNPARPRRSWRSFTLLLWW